MAEKACHAVACATQFGLTQALDMLRRFFAIPAYLCLLGTLVPACAYAGVCRIRLANEAPHAAFNQQFMAALESEVRASSALQIDPDKYDLGFYLVDVHTDAIPGFPNSEGPRIFHALTDHDNRLISASIWSCGGEKDYSRCAAKVAHRLTDMCERMSNNSFKPSPLRGLGANRFRSGGPA